MRETKSTTVSAETFVRQVVEKTFGQKLDAETLKAVADKVREAVPAPEAKRHLAKASAA